VTSVTCVMLTAGRRRFVSAAIQMFLAQDYPDKELLIIDNGLDRVHDLAVSCPEIRYVREAAGRSLGAKAILPASLPVARSYFLGTRTTWYAPGHVRYQVDASSRAALT
jgi:hypothetical protein